MTVARNDSALRVESADSHVSNTDHGAAPGRRREFEDVALIHLDRLYRMARWLCRSHAQAEDLVQETYLRAFTHFEQFSRGTNCRAWLFAILRNTFMNRMKRERREVLGLNEGDLERAESGCSELTMTIPNPEEEFFRRSVDRDLAEALHDLPVRFRQAVLLADLDACSYKEIAQICQVPVGTVMSRLFRARQLLKKSLRAG